MRRLFFIFLTVSFMAILFIAPLLFAAQTTAEPEPAPAAILQPETEPANVQRPYRAVWVSYLEWQNVDFSSAAAFKTDVEKMMNQMADLGATVVLAHVRPFGDALYRSELFPFSHLCTGVQGQNPGFDPLLLLVEAAHDRGLEVEAWINPYRLQSGGVPELCEKSLAVLHPEWVKSTQQGLYLNPASAAVRQFIADGVAELCENYAVDGIHFDDYFYPDTDPAFDAAEYAAAGTPLVLDDWRRGNVNALMQLCCAAAHRYGVRFGVAPQGDPDLCRNAQYSDAALWLAQSGYADYVMPQLYWGLQYTKNGNTTHSTAALAARWDAMRAGGAKLYFGLGAYRIGAGDGSDIPGEWQTGNALCSQLKAIHNFGDGGCGLYRYASLWENDAYAAAAAAERRALTALWHGA